jgi:hypothetical protein
MEGAIGTECSVGKAAGGWLGRARRRRGETLAPGDSNFWETGARLAGAKVNYG